MDPFRIKTRDTGSRSRHVSSRYQHDLGWEESLIEGESVGEDEEARVVEDSEHRRLFWLVVLVVVTLGTLLYRAAVLQIVQGEELKVAAEINRVRKFPVPAPRGVIFDRFGEQLVENVPSFQIVLTPADLLNLSDDEQQQSITKLSQLSGVGEEEIRQVVSASDRRSYEPIIIIESIDRDKALVMESKAEEIIGFQVISNSRRNYFEPLLSHVLGYTGSANEDELAEHKNKAAYFGIDEIGKTGIEQVYDEGMRGVPGSKQIEVDATGREENVVAVKDPDPGRNIELGIDAGLQRKAAVNMEHILRTGGLTKASFVALDPRNGEVLALLNFPGFDNDKFAEGISPEEYSELISDPNQPLFNRSIGGTYASGSVIKPIIGAAALEEKVIDDKTTVNDIGYLEIENKYDPSIKYRFYGWNKTGLGSVNIYTGTALSSNPFFYQIGGGYQGFVGLGPELIGEYMRSFGFGSVSGIDLPSEAEGLVPGREWKQEMLDERWSLGDTYNLSIGQGYFLTTPLQMANATAAIANGGTVYKPHLAKTFVDEVSGETTEVESEVINSSFVSPANIDITRRAMLETVVNAQGTARSLQGLPVAVAAKTGTAQFQGSTLEHSWFIAFAPYDDPQIALAVLVEEGGSGAEAAAIVARDTLNWYFGGRPEDVEEDGSDLNNNGTEELIIE
ncbi:penicillin-binding protein 2 [Patescibacteria group bacterium]